MRSLKAEREASKQLKQLLEELEKEMNNKDIISFNMREKVIFIKGFIYCLINN